MTVRLRLLIGFLLANLTVAAVAGVLLFNQGAAPPQIQGVLLDEAREIPLFELRDHDGSAFSNGDLLGRWHLVSYGFTTCPDICPTMLSSLARFSGQLDEAERRDLQVLFYSVDHRRDTSARMARYVTYFDPGFQGLTHLDDPDNPHLPFEQGLGIVSRLEPVLDEAGVPTDEYTVSHGVTLLLLNPRGELQAVFKPDNRGPQQHSFDVQTLLRDYRAIRRHLG